MRNAQKEGYHILVIDTENALDFDYLNKIGVDTSEDKMTYTQVVMIEDVNRVLSEFFTSYNDVYGKGKTQEGKGPKVLIVIDSLAGLSSSTEIENYERDGTIKGDQGQLAKRRKAMLRMITNHIARVPMAVVMTDHVYPQDIMLGDGAWAITNSTKFSTSIIGIITRLKLKEGTEVVGVRMRFETYKSRFAKIGTKVELEVPYSSGMSPFSGLVELLEALGVIAKGTEPGEKTKWVSHVDGKKIAFKEDELTHEIAHELFKHPNASPILERDEPETGFGVQEDEDE
jgi:recombination protein RecA